MPSHKNRHHSHHNDTKPEETTPSSAETVVTEAIGTASEAVHTAASAAASTVSSAAAAATGSPSGAARSHSSTKDHAIEKINETVEYVQQRAADGVQYVKGTQAQIQAKGEEVVQRAADVYEQGTKVVHDKIDQTKQRATDVYEQGTKVVHDKIDQTKQHVGATRNHIEGAVQVRKEAAVTWMKGDCRETEVERFVVKAASTVVAVGCKIASKTLELVGLRERAETTITSLRSTCEQTIHKNAYLEGTFNACASYWPTRLIGRVLSTIDSNVRAQL